MAINEWRSNRRDLSTREKRIKTNSAVKINLTAYKNCHNYHLNAIVLRSIFYLDCRRNACDTLWNFTISHAKIDANEISRRYQETIKGLWIIYGPVDIGRIQTDVFNKINYDTPRHSKASLSISWLFKGVCLLLFLSLLRTKLYKVKKLYTEL